MATSLHQDVPAAGLKAYTNFREFSTEGLLFALGISTAPVSIAASECALAISLVFRVIALRQSRRVTFLPRIFWLWSAWAVLELGVWLHLPPLRTGIGEIRHLALILGMFLLVPTLDRLSWRIAVWRAVAATGTLSSTFLIAHFVSQMLSYPWTG